MINDVHLQESVSRWCAFENGRILPSLEKLLDSVNDEAINFECSRERISHRFL